MRKSAQEGLNVAENVLFGLGKENRIFGGVQAEFLVMKVLIGF